jgi:predicted N-formylglutamate amidohydrolase
VARRAAPPRLVLSCEHARGAVPPELRALFRGTAELRAGHRGHDAGALALARSLARRLGCQLHEGLWTRLVVDLNRPAGHPSRLGPALRRLPAAEQAAVLARHWEPWHRALRADLDRASLDGRVRHLSVHSFTPVWRGRPRAVGIGVLDDPRRPAERAWSAALLAALREELPGVVVRRNQPYRGWTPGAVSALRAERGAGYQGLELEVSQALLAGPEAAAVRRAVRVAVEASLECA